MRRPAQLAIRVHGRPAPQGSKRLGAQGQLLEQSPYLHAWRGHWQGTGARRQYRHGAVGRAVYEAYRAMSLPPDELPLFVGPIAVTILFYLATDPDEPPDLDKLARSTFDALTVCRVFEDDARVRIAHLSKTAATSTEPPGAFILVAPYRPWRREAARLRARELERRAARWGVFFGSA